MAKGTKSGKGSKLQPPLKEPERPWQADIVRVEQTMREVLRAMASLSGVELPGLPPELQDDGATPPRLDMKTLKDRIRNELEGFSIKTTAEVAKRAKEQTHAALDAIQNEVGDRIDQAADEFREKVQIERLLEPFIEEAAVRLERSFRQKVEHLFAEQERSVQDRLQEALSSVRTQISTLEQAVQQICELKADLVPQLTAERPNAAVDNANRECESGLTDELHEAPRPAPLRIEWPSNTLLETHEIQLGQGTTTGPEEQRKVTTFNLTDMESRVQRALELLDGLGSKNPRPASREKSH